jgi:hypothetical protein
MLKETPESVRAIVSLFALYALLLGSLQLGLGASYDIVGGLLVILPGLGYTYVAIRWYSLLKGAPKQVRFVLKANLFLAAAFVIYRIYRGADSSVAIGFAIAFFGTLFVLSGVDAYSSKILISPRDEEKANQSSQPTSLTRRG